MSKAPPHKDLDPAASKPIEGVATGDEDRAGRVTNGYSTFMENHHIGETLEGKRKPFRPFPEKGPNPRGERVFTGGEIARIMTFERPDRGEEAKPTFVSCMTPDKNEVRINIATQIPETVKSRETGEETPWANSRQAEKIKNVGSSAFPYKAFEDAFAEVPEKYQEALATYAKDFEESFGIKVTIGKDLEDYDMIIMGFKDGDHRTLGSGSFPNPVDAWPVMEGLGCEPGYLLINNDYIEHDQTTLKDAYDLHSHEWGHCFQGLVHPHDLGLLDMPVKTALAATKMSYTDLNMRAFRHVVTDGEGAPVLDDNGEKQFFYEGSEEGVIDLQFRHWVENPPPLGVVEQPDPTKEGYDGYKGVYDLQAHYDFAVAENKGSTSYKKDKVLPMVAMINDGKHTVLRGSENDDLLDTNLGYSSIVKSNCGREQHFVLNEGHIEKVMGITGNNQIIVAQNGNQEIHPGTGNNNIQMLYTEMDGDKTIVSEGTDTLTLAYNLLEEKKITATDGKNGDIVLNGDNFNITLRGGGIKEIAVLDSLGPDHNRIDISGMSAAELNAQFFENENWKNKPQQQQAAEEPAEAVEPQVPNRNTDTLWRNLVGDKSNALNPPAAGRGGRG
ncbi:MAG: hypothetical protein MK052_10210 [Alphaproteobacteria bacterium]|nr:hypothetical protein [Alphaproteobacteria bacterium]